jgi:acyl-coenzyme A synthetase/AMP-(fatty) acid ligase
LYDGIGSTEAMHIFCSNRPGRSRAGSSGVPVRDYELRIVDGSGVPVPAGEAGQLLVRGKTFAKGYWNREEATRTSFRGEWLATGDIYRQDADGYFLYLGRQDDVFKCSGMWISPGEIEQALLSHPLVREAAVVGVGNEAGLTSAKAFVVLDEAADLRDKDSTRAAIIAHLRKGLSKYKVPAQIDFLSALPKTATGKISRAELRRRHSAGCEPATVS